jgi:hypothetical protein
LVCLGFAFVLGWLHWFRLFGLGWLVGWFPFTFTFGLVTFVLLLVVTFGSPFGSLVRCWVVVDVPIASTFDICVRLVAFGWFSCVWFVRSG